MREFSDSTRHGVFLVPDAQTSAAVTMITTFLRAQFGLVSAGRFPPHATLAGSLPLAAPESELLAAVASVVDRTAPITVVNHGPRPMDFGIVYDVHEGVDGAPNAALVELAANVADAVSPLLGSADGLAPDVRSREDWRGHLSLASHDLIERLDLGDEVEEFVRQLAQPYPPTFLARRVAVYRQHHRDWGESWWREFTWEHVRSFPLGGSSPA